MQNLEFRLTRYQAEELTERVIARLYRQGGGVIDWGHLATTQPPIWSVYVRLKQRLKTRIRGLE